MIKRGNQTFLVFLLLMATCPASSFVSGQDEAQEPKIDYTTTIKPIIDARCTTCHNENDEEGGLNLDDLEMFQEYVVSGKPLESGIFQSLTGSNDLSQMPPEEDNDGNPLEPCTPSEMALIFLWIQQGASFEGVPVEEKKEEAPKSPAERIFLFSGYFHPAIVHFPIALITMSAFFIIVFFRNDALSDDAAFYLLLFGALSSIVACVFGWAFAERNPVAMTDMALGINRHRWFGIGATVLALISTFLGWRARNEVLSNRSGLWKFGVIITAALMGVVGHQGGEEVYGEGVYDRAAQKLIPEYWPFAKEDQKKTEEQSDQPDPNKNADEKGENGEVEDNKQAEANNGESQTQEKEAENQSNSNKGGDDEGGQSGDDDKSGPPPTDPTIKKDDQ